jgi:16S rRNA pseudouridine516 synthase
MELERLLRSQGFGSRADCRSLVFSGRVAIDGVVCDDPGADFEAEGLVFTVDSTGWLYREHAYLVLNKPAGYECSHSPRFHPSVYALLPRPLVARGVQAVGRLDADTTGLLLLSDDGDFIHRYTSPKKQIDKVYEVGVKHAFSEAQRVALLSGVVLRDEKRAIAASACVIIGERRVRLTVSEGKYHLVKRMIAAAGNRVEALARVAIGGLALPTALAPGAWSWLGEDELARLANGAPQFLANARGLEDLHSFGDER